MEEKLTEYEWNTMFEGYEPLKYPELYEEATKEENILKNRYGDMLPLDSTRLILNKKGNYVNANWVNVGHEFWICCQCPKLEMIEDFWYMVYQYNVKVIGMFVSVKGDENKRGNTYWHEQPGNFFYLGGCGIKVLTTEKVKNGDITLIYLEVSKEGGKVVEVCIYHYRKWEKEIKDENIKSFFDKTKTIDYNSENVIIQSSSGSGRAGIICSIYRYLRTGESIKNIIENLRTFRYHMVNTYEQYEFIYDFLKSEI